MPIQIFAGLPIYFLIKIKSKGQKDIEQMSIQGIKITKDKIHYIFPKQLEQIKQFSNINQHKQQLMYLFKSLQNILPNFPYRTKYLTPGYAINLQCSFCPNKLAYQLNRSKGKFQLKSFSVDHMHGINFDNQQVKMYQPVTIYSIDTPNIEEIIKQKVSYLQQPLAYHIKPKHQTPSTSPNTFSELIRDLKSQNCFVSYSPQNYEQLGLKYPDLLMVISQQMKTAYLTHARSIGFDFTYSLIKETPLAVNGKRQYMIGVIAGLNQYRRIGIFALVIANEESAVFVQKIFTSFIGFMGKQPESIVTDQAWGILAGIKQIKKKGVYHGQAFWDTFHVLKTYKFRNKILKNHMRMMIRQKCKYQFHKMYLEAVRMARTQQQMDAIHQFLYQSQKYCISQITPAFIGLGVSDSQNQILNNLIKNIIPYESTYVQVVHKIIGFIQERNILAEMIARETCRIDEVVNIKELQIVRYSLCRTVYAFLFTQICRSCKVDLIYHNNTNTFFCIQDANTIHYVKKTSVQQNEDKSMINKINYIKNYFQCTCLFQQKTGIPCQHIIKVIFQTDNNFIDRIDQYWIIEEPDKLYKCISNIGQQGQKVIKKRGRPAGKPILFYKHQNNNKKLPKGISTFQPMKPKTQNQIQGNNHNNLIDPNFNFSQHHSNILQNKEEKQKNFRMHIMKEFYVNKQQL